MKVQRIHEMNVSKSELVQRNRNTIERKHKNLHVQRFCSLAH
jgi:hypothetical protein